MTPFISLAPEVTVAEVGTSEIYEVFAATHTSPAHTVEDALRHIAEHLDIETDGEVTVPASLAVPTAEQVTATTEFFDLFAEGSNAVALPTGEWLSHPGVLAAPGDVDDRLHLAPWATDPDALDRIEYTGVPAGYARDAWTAGIHTLDALLEAWDAGVPVKFLSNGGAL